MIYTHPLLFNAMLVFTVVAVLGAVQAVTTFKGQYAAWGYTYAHGALSVAGALFVAAAYLTGDHRVLANIALVAVIAPLGFYIARQRKHGKSTPNALIVAHAVLAVGCYVLLGFYTVR